MAPTVRESTTEESTVTVETTPTAQTGRSTREGVYEVPIIRASVPERLVDGGFWAALATLAVTGAVDPPWRSCWALAWWSPGTGARSATSQPSCERSSSKCVGLVSDRGIALQA